MKYKVINKSNMDFDKFRPILSSFMSYATKKMGFKPLLFLLLMNKTLIYLLEKQLIMIQTPCKSLYTPT